MAGDCREAKHGCPGNQISVLLLMGLLPSCSNVKDTKRRPRVPLLPSPRRSSAWSAITCCKASGAIFAASGWMSRCWRMRMTTGRLLRSVTRVRGGVCVCVLAPICAPWWAPAADGGTALGGHCTEQHIESWNQFGWKRP